MGKAPGLRQRRQLKRNLADCRKIASGMVGCGTVCVIAATFVDVFAAFSGTELLSPSRLFWGGLKFLAMGAIILMAFSLSDDAYEVNGFEHAVELIASVATAVESVLRGIIAMVGAVMGRISAGSAIVARKLALKDATTTTTMTTTTLKEKVGDGVVDLTKCAD